MGTTSGQLSVSDQIQDLYVAFYDRPADQGGLNYWAGVVQSDFSGNVGAIVNYFVEQPEASSFYNKTYEIINTTDGSINSTYIINFLDQVYQNLFNRSPDSGGLQYWEGVYNTYHMSAGQLVLDIIGGAQGSDITAISNKLQAADVFTTTMGSSYTSSDLPAAYSFNSIISAATASGTLNSIANTSFVNSFVTESTSGSYTLTTGTDFFIGANPTSNTFYGSPETWTQGDNITGASNATNTLNFSDDRTGGTTNYTVQNPQGQNMQISGNDLPQWNLNPTGSSVSGIQNVNVTSQSSVLIDTTNWSGVTDLTVTADDSFNNNSTITAAATTNINFTDNGLADYVDTINGGNNVAIIEKGEGTGWWTGSTLFVPGAINVNGINGTSSVSVTQTLGGSLSDGYVYAPVVIKDYNSTQSTPSAGTITSVTMDGISNVYEIQAGGGVNYPYAYNIGNASTEYYTLNGNIYVFSSGSTAAYTYNAATITDNALSNLTVNNAVSDSNVVINDSAKTNPSNNTLTLNLNNDSNTTITEISDGSSIKGQYTTLNVVTGSNSSSTILMLSAVTALNLSGQSTLNIEPAYSNQILPALQTLSVTGNAGLTAVITSTGTIVPVLPTSLTSITDSSSGLVTVALPTNTTGNQTTANFDGSSSTGQDIVAIVQPLASAASIKAGTTATNNELVFTPSANFGTETIGSTSGVFDSLGSGTITGFQVLGINDSGYNVSNSFDIALLGAQLGGFNNTIDLLQIGSGNQRTTKDTLYNLTNNSTLQFDDLYNNHFDFAWGGKLNAVFSGSNGAGDTVNLALNHVNAVYDMLVNGLTFTDSASTPNGIGTVNITDNYTTSNTFNDVINSIKDISLATLTVASNQASLEIGSITDNPSTALSSVTISLSGSANFVIGSASNTINAASIIINDTSSSPAPTFIGPITDSSLTSLTLGGSHAAIVDIAQPVGTGDSIEATNGVTGNELGFTPNGNFGTETLNSQSVYNSFGTSSNVGTISGFQVLGINDPTGNNSFDIAALGSQLGSFNNTIDLQQVGNSTDTTPDVTATDTLYKVVNDSTLQFDNYYNHHYQWSSSWYGNVQTIFSDTSGTTDTANVVLNHTSSVNISDGMNNSNCTPGFSYTNNISINGLTFTDSASTPNGIGTLNITDNSKDTYYSGTADTTNYSDTIIAITDNSLSTLNLISTNLTLGSNNQVGLQIGSINDNPSTPLSSVTINLSGSANFVIGSGYEGWSTSGASSTINATALTINDNSTNANATDIAGTGQGAGFTSYTLNDNALTNLTFEGTHSAGVRIGTISDNSPSLTISNTSSATDTITTLNDSALTSLTLSGTGALTINAISSTAGVTVSASSDNANLNLTLTGAASGNTDNITLGNGANSITDNSTAGTVNITVGTGANTINVSSGNSSTFIANITLGTHTINVDTISVSPYEGQTNPFSAAITGIAANDTIILPDSSATYAVPTSSPSSGTLTEYINYYLASGGEGSAHDTFSFQYTDGNTYVVDNVNGGSTLSNGDIVVELVGAHTISNATITSGHVVVAS